MLYALVLVTSFGVLVYCALDVLRTPAAQVRILPKVLWLALIVLFPLLAALPWLVFGRPAERALRGPGGPVGPVGPVGQVAPPARPVARPHPDDDEEFLRHLRERAEEQRRRAREQEPPTA